MGSINLQVEPANSDSAKKLYKYVVLQVTLIEYFFQL